MTTTYSIGGFVQVYDDDTDALINFSPVTFSVTFDDSVPTISYTTEIF